MKKLFPLYAMTVFLSLPLLSSAQLDRFQLPEGKALEVWRLTNDPTVRDHANYHNTQCWSQDGRYVGFTHYASNGVEYGTSEAAEIHIYDLFKKEDILVDNGTSPRWANDHNWLFYVRSRPDEGPGNGKGSQVMWLDVDQNKKQQIAIGVQSLNEPDSDDRWVTGFQYPANGEKRAVRIPIKENARPEDLKGIGKYIRGSKWNINPAYPIMSYWDLRFKNYYYATEGTRDIPFSARHRVFVDMEGGNRTTPFPIMEGSHFTWSGDGEYFLCGNGQVRGIRRNETLPANIHFLAAIRVGDICRAGLSGRWIAGSTNGGRGPLRLADTRSGDGWEVLKALSVIAYPGTGDNSGPYDIDAKGSPDGTKIAFVSNYDLKNGPYTKLTEAVSGDKFVVKSTDGFPAKGRLVVATGFYREVLSYERKTATTFEGLKRGLYETPVSSPRIGEIVTSFEARLIPREKWERLALPSKSIREIITDENSPLRKQRSSDIYVAVVRRPDRPWLRKIEGELELIPGENHWETFGYDLYRNGKKITTRPVGPGDFFSLEQAGNYSAVAVEWSGLESEKSNSLRVDDSATLRIREDKPADFSWTSERWLVKGKAVSEEQTSRSEQSLKEIVHLYDGVIGREKYNWGQIVEREDLNLNGFASRRLFYRNGKLARREYHLEETGRVSSEFFDEQGFITETIQYGYEDGMVKEVSHWWYDHAVPIRNIRNGTVYEKDGSRWVKK